MNRIEKEKLFVMRIIFKLDFFLHIDVVYQSDSLLMYLKMISAARRDAEVWKHSVSHVACTQHKSFIFFSSRMHKLSAAAREKEIPPPPLTHRPCVVRRKHETGSSGMRRAVGWNIKYLENLFFSVVPGWSGGESEMYLSLLWKMCFSFPGWGGGWLGGGGVWLCVCVCVCVWDDDDDDEAALVGRTVGQVEQQQCVWLCFTSHQRQQSCCSDISFTSLQSLSVTLFIRSFHFIRFLLSSKQTSLFPVNRHKWWLMGIVVP